MPRSAFANDTAWPDVGARRTDGFFVGRLCHAAAVQTVANNRMRGDPGGSEQKSGHEERGNTVSLETSWAMCRFE